MTVLLWAGVGGLVLLAVIVFAVWRAGAAAEAEYPPRGEPDITEALAGVPPREIAAPADPVPRAHGGPAVERQLARSRRAQRPPGRAAL